MDGRSGRHEIRKGFLLKGKVAFPGIGIAILILLLIKVAMSFFFLQSGEITLSSTKLAMAENKGISAVPQTAEPSTPNLAFEAVKKKEREIKEKERDLEKREAALAPLKKEIDTKLAELNELQTRLTAYAKKLAEREKALDDARNEHLVALYGAMEPARAAAIMDKLKLDTVVLILRNMKGKTAGQIMAMMNPERGAMISEKLSKID